MTFEIIDLDLEYDSRRWTLKRLGDTTMLFQNLEDHKKAMDVASRNNGMFTDANGLTWAWDGNHWRLATATKSDPEGYTYPD